MVISFIDVRVTARLLHTGDTLHDKILPRDGASLVEATDVDSTGKRYPEGFSTEDS